MLKREHKHIYHERARQPVDENSKGVLGYSLRECTRRGCEYPRQTFLVKLVPRTWEEDGEHGYMPHSYNEYGEVVGPTKEAMFFLDPAWKRVPREMLGEYKGKR